MHKPIKNYIGSPKVGLTTLVRLCGADHQQMNASKSEGWDQI